MLHHDRWQRRMGASRIHFLPITSCAFYSFMLECHAHSHPFPKNTDTQNYQDPEESDAYEDDDSADGGKKKEAAPANTENYAVLDGKVLLNEEGRVSYVGTWQMKKDRDAAAAAAEFASGDDEEAGGKKSKKKKQKFKLKSRQTMSTNGSSDGGPIFLLDNPTVSKKEDPQTIPSKRTMMFDGFFFTPEEEGHRKIKEKDVEVTFSVVEGDPSSFKVEGKGINDFGAFTIEGTYKSSGSEGSNPLVSNKEYVPVGGDDGDFDDEASDDDEMSDAEEAEYGELVALNEEANMSVEELRKRYYGGGGGGGDDDDDEEDAKKPAAKKSKVVADDSDDEACGF